MQVGRTRFSRCCYLIIDLGSPSFFLKTPPPSPAEGPSPFFPPPFLQRGCCFLTHPPAAGGIFFHFLGRYTHRVAISNHRLVSFAEGKVTFRWRDSAHHNEQKLLTLSLDEFLRRFLLHVLPKGFVRIRNFDSSPTGDAPRSCHFAFICSAQHRRQSKTYQAAKTQVIFGSAQNAVHR